jgi:hypothetical protein
VRAYARRKRKRSKAPRLPFRGRGLPVASLNDSDFSVIPDASPRASDAERDVCRRPAQMTGFRLQAIGTTVANRPIADVRGGAPRPMKMGNIASPWR